jgi:glycosyltransferase A (GT-A) superfamily protein (DUF2064 family)
LTPASAILLFSRTASSEAINKPFICGSAISSKKITDRIITDSLAKIKKTNLPFYIIDETKQSGENFGQRLSNAVEDVFSRGHDRVIIIGNDCPQLRSKHILYANELLENAPLVLGKDNHGGAYLIGVCKDSFQKNIFASLRWQTPFLFNDLKNFSLNAILPDLLFDINQPKDITSLLKLLSVNSLLYRLLHAVLSGSITQRKNLRFISAFVCQYSDLRAPPASL